METILVVDDRQEQVDLIADFLRAGGYNPLTTTKPAKALEMAVKNKPDLIICDLVMPEMDGMDVCHHLRNSDLPFIPFMVLTGVDEARFEEYSFSIGADEYLTKPVSMESLLQKVKALLAQTKSLRELENTGRLEGVIKKKHDHTLLTLFQFLALNHLTGLVEILGTEASGFVHFTKGTIVQADFDGRKDLDGMIEIVRQNSGRYRFTTREQTKERRIEENTMNLLIEACRIADERTELNN